MAGRKIFLSYSRSDSGIASKLTEELESSGADVWFDRQDIRLGSVWEKEIEKAISSCDCLLFIASCSSVESDKALNEVHFAMEENKVVLPVKIDNCKIPLGISRLHYIDLSTNYEEGLKVLLKELDLDDRQELKKESSASPLTMSEAEVRQREEDGLREESNRQPLESKDDKSDEGKKPKKGIRVNLTCSVVLAMMVLVVSTLMFIQVGTNGASMDQADVPVTAEPKGGGSSKNDSPDLTSDPDSSYQEGVKYYESGDYETALRWFKSAASGGETNSMVYLGYMYSTGIGVGQNTAEAINWYTKAAEAGNAEGMFRLAMLYKDGEGEVQDSGKAQHWFKNAFEAYRNAAKAGEPSSMYYTGYFYENGLGVDKNDKMARYWYNKAKEAGYEPKE